MKLYASEEKCPWS